MFNSSIFKIEACAYSELCMHSQVFNTAQLGYVLYVSLPTSAMACSTPTEVIEVGVDDAENILDQCKWRPGGCWIDILSDSLNTSVGYHRYRITLLNQFTNVLHQLYFAYTIQNDTPDKPYVYMIDHDESQEDSDASS